MDRRYDVRKVITGARRSGNSKLLEAFKDYMEENVDGANIIYINFNLTKFEALKDSSPRV